MVPFASGLVPPLSSSGEARWYTPSPCQDLRIVTASEASYINRQWLDAILDGDTPPEDKHVTEAINRFEQRIQDHHGIDMYMAWTPSGCANDDALFLVVIVVPFATRDRMEVHHAHLPIAVLESGSN